MIRAALLLGVLIAGQPVEVIDGDTIRVDGETIRILGLDAPETWQAQCEAEREAGKRAAGALARLLASGRLEIERAGQDRYGRTLATVLVDGGNVADGMISAGFARPYEGGQRRSWGWCATADDNRD